jgi:DNA-binding NtrC family response regulator
MTTLLVIDDDPIIHGIFRQVFTPAEATLRLATSTLEGVEALARLQTDVVVLDVNLGQESGLETFRQIHALDPRLPVIFITGEGTTATAIEAMALGAYDYILKPFGISEMRAIVFRAFEVSRLMRTPARVPELEPTEEPADTLVGRCPAMQEVYKAIGRVARQDVTVLITGESGTGKELVARAIYHYGLRSGSPFLAINCAAIPETLLESELFGHERGAFTGAECKRIGKFEQCNGGTLFLDEIGDMTPLTQSKILRVIQEQRFERVGGQQSIQTNVRLIAATNRNLEQMVATDRFRKDLFYRLNGYTIPLPPLRERTDDLPLLADHFRRRFNRELNKEVHGIAGETLDLLRRYGWPGNVRELQSVVKYALLHSTGQVLLPNCLPSSFTEKKNARAPSPAGLVFHFGDLEYFLQERLRAGSTNLNAEWHALIEANFLSRVLQHTRGNISQAARILGIDRGTLRSRIKALGISPAEGTSPEEPPPAPDPTP